MNNLELLNHLKTKDKTEVVTTLEEIAKLANVPVEQLRIKE